MSTITLTEEQANAAALLSEWIASDRQEFVLAGLAGTGKSTTLGHLISTGELRPAITLTPTGKAADVLRGKGVRAETIHSAIKLFRAERWNKEKNKLEPVFEDGDAEFGPGDVVIVDEASMVNTELAEDLRATGARIVWVGDHGQLEPVGGDPKLMQNADVMLEKVMRQAETSPILRLAHGVRGGKTLAQMRTDAYRGEVNFYGRARPADVARIADEGGYDQIICWTNKERRMINSATRSLREHVSDVPEVGERIIMTKNDRTLGVYNGQQYYVKEVGEHFGDHVTLEVESVDTGRTIRAMFWSVLFDREPTLEDVQARPRRVLEADFAYAITAHKAQGSEWPAVLVSDAWKRQGMERWRYTAATRAAELLGVVG